MEPKKRLFIAFSVTTILMLALLTSIGRSLLSLSTPSVTLPSVSVSTADNTELLEGNALYRIDITPATVQSVISSLNADTSYSRTLSTTLFWSDAPEDSVETTAEIWYHQGVSHVEKLLPSGMTRHDMITEDTVYYWYQGYSDYLSKPADVYASDLAQCIPSYQTVLNLGVESIQEASYQYKEGVPCIFVSATPAPLFYTERYWISTETGLLVAAETYEGSKLIYRMEGFEDISPLPYGTSFVLPDGTVLLEMNETT